MWAGDFFIKNYMGFEKGVGIDIYPYESVTEIVENMTNIPYGDESFDTITLIAVGGHIPRSIRIAEFMEFAHLLRNGGRLIMTEGEPITQFIAHKWYSIYFRLQGKMDVDSERGMEHDEEYCMSRDEILSYLNQPPLKYSRRKRFMWGLNNVYFAEKDLSDER